MERTAAAHTGLSIEPPQRTQVSSSVSLMRTIVECSPQDGQYAINWNRCRQKTHR
jgi:hypothetical protein